MGHLKIDNSYHLQGFRPRVNTFYIQIYNSDIFTKSKKSSIINKLTVLNERIKKPKLG